uniref:Peroxisomal catalase (EC) n=1 Tax=Ganoderma boninense TaxID=34458 RepID=A0A5K1K3W4_9APHY|nr:Peroxisomal catalase (EC [Ganoderma boninense]
MDMDLSKYNLPAVFKQLSHLSDGDHTVYIRAGPHSFHEVRSSGARDLFSTNLAAFIPASVIKLQTPLAASIIAAVPSPQGAATLHTRSNVFIVQNMSDVVNVIQYHKAAFIREDAALAVWADDMDAALLALHQILEELAVLLDGPGVVRALDPNEMDGHTAGDSGAACDEFDEFLNNFDDPADKYEEHLAVYQPGRNVLLPARSLDGADEPDSMYVGSCSNLFDSLSTDSLMLGGSPFLSTGVSSSMSRLCLDGTPHAPPSPTFSTLSFDFSSPSASSGSVFSTPLTIAPSVLSSPLSAWSSPQLPTISESCLEDTLQDMSLVHSVNPSLVDAPSKRKRSPKAKQAPPADAAVPEKTRPRRASRVATSPKVAPSPSPRARKTVSKAIMPVLPPSERVATHTHAAQLTLPRVTHAACCGSDGGHDHDHHEILESDDSGSEYEADPYELELAELDDDEYDEYRPAKRTRSRPCSAQAASQASSVKTSPVGRKAVSPKVASSKKKAPKRKRSSFGRATSKKKAAPKKPEGPPPTCVWCDRIFTRESDVLRHERCSCEWYPFDRPAKMCPLCFKDLSRDDAVLRHQGSDNCKDRQDELRAEGVLPPKKTKTAASARAAAKKAETAAQPQRRSTRALSL